VVETGTFLLRVTCMRATEIFSVVPRLVLSSSLSLVTVIHGGRLSPTPTIISLPSPPPFSHPFLSCQRTSAAAAHGPVHGVCGQGLLLRPRHCLGLLLLLVEGRKEGGREGGSGEVVAECMAEAE